MKTRICPAICLLMGLIIQSCLQMDDPPKNADHEYIIGKWGLKSAKIENSELKWICTPETTFYSLNRKDTVELSEIYPEFQDSVWEIVFTKDTVFSPNDIENRIKFDWALPPATIIDNDFITEKFAYDIGSDTLNLKNSRTEAYHKIHHYYKFKIVHERRELEIEPGVNWPDSSRGPKPVSNRDYICPDSIEQKSKLVAVTLWKK